MTAAGIVVDTHVHVIDLARFPLPVGGGGYIPRPDETGTVEELAAVSDGFGVTHQVIVQPSGAGTDNRATLDAVAHAPDRRRAIVACAPDVDVAELDALRAAGAAGLRLNVVTLGRAALEAMLPRLRSFGETGFIVQLECSASVLEEIAPLLAPEAGPIILDHLGRPSLQQGLDRSGLATVLALAERGAIVKLSGAFRVSREPFPHPDLDPVIAALRKRVPISNFIWGSDWPFLAMDVRPTYQSTLALLERWFPSAEDRRRILADNPARLFGFST